MDGLGEKKNSLEVQPYKMTRKVSFRDETEGQKKEIADVHYVESLKHLHVEEPKGFSCLKCQIF